MKYLEAGCFIITFCTVNSRNSHWKEDTDNGSYPLAVPLLLLTDFLDNVISQNL